MSASESKFDGIGFLSQQAVIFNKAGEVLALQFSNYDSDKIAGKWTLPGGTMDESDESTHIGLRREVREETGIDVDVLHPVRVGKFINFDGRKRILALYLCKSNSDFNELSHEHTQFKWLSVEQAIKLDWINEHYPGAIMNAARLWELEDNSIGSDAIEVKK
tara:strand:- start:186 stop:671 length:486 start_codon:yes stop_codon:yes gene_type:complete